jgi:aprataxin and PNK-like factor
MADEEEEEDGKKEEEEADSRPECEYGVDCYRKNPDHRKSFKHTHKPEKPRRTKVIYYTISTG